MPSLWTTALLVCAFFFAYYVYEPPYRGLYPDLLPETAYGRSQGVQHLFRGLAIARRARRRRVPVPGVGTGAVSARRRSSSSRHASCPIVFVREDGGHGRVFEGVRAYLRHSWRVLRANRDVAKFLVANSAWEGTFAGARTFVLLYVTVGLGESVTTSSIVLAAVAGGYIVAALVAGPLGDRFGLAPLIVVASVVYGGGLLGGGLATEWHAWYLAIIFFVAIAGGTVMTLAWGLLFKLMPAGDRGAVAGLATTTKGIGLVIGPLFVGACIDLLRGPFGETAGYQALWPLLGIPILLVVPLVWSLMRAESVADGLARARQAEAPHVSVDDVDDGVSGDGGP